MPTSAPSFDPRVDLGSTLAVPSSTPSSMTNTSSPRNDTTQSSRTTVATMSYQDTTPSTSNVRVKSKSRSSRAKKAVSGGVEEHKSVQSSSTHQSRRSGRSKKSHGSRGSSKMHQSGSVSSSIQRHVKDLSRDFNALIGMGFMYPPLPDVLLRFLRSIDTPEGQLQFLRAKGFNNCRAYVHQSCMDIEELVSGYSSAELRSTEVYNVIVKIFCIGKYIDYLFCNRYHIDPYTQQVHIQTIPQDIPHSEEIWEEFNLESFRIITQPHLKNFVINLQNYLDEYFKDDIMGSTVTTGSYRSSRGGYSRGSTVNSHHSTAPNQGGSFHSVSVTTATSEHATSEHATSEHNFAFVPPPMSIPMSTMPAVPSPVATETPRPPVPKMPSHMAGRVPSVNPGTAAAPIPNHMPSGMPQAVPGTSATPVPSHVASGVTPHSQGGINIPNPVTSSAQPSQGQAGQLDQQSMTSVKELANSFMAGINARDAQLKLTASGKDISRAVLPTRVMWDGDLGTFESFQNKVEGHYGQTGAGYLFDSEFVESYEKHGIECYKYFLNDVKTPSQVKKDSRALFGALRSACDQGNGKATITRFKKTQDGILAWKEMVQRFEADGDPNIRITRLEKVISMEYSRHYPGGLFKWIQNYENAFTELVLLGVEAWKNDAEKKRRMIANACSIGIQPIILNQMTKSQNFNEFCNTLRTHAILLKDRENVSSRRAQSVEQHSPEPTMSNGDTTDTDNVSPSDLLAMVCRLYNIPAEAWNLLPDDVKRLVYKARESAASQTPKKEDSNPKQPNGTSTRSSGMPSQYNKPTQYSKANQATKESQEQGGVTEEQMESFLEDAGTFAETLEDLSNAQYKSIGHTRIVHVSKTDSTISHCFNSMDIPDHKHLAILDDGADTCVIGKGWTIVATHPTRKAHVLGFDSDIARKHNLSIVSAITAVDLPQDKVALIQVHEAVYNPSAAHSLLSEFQLREYGTIVDSVPIRHGGKQRMIVDEQEIPLGVRSCMVHFKHRLPSEAEFNKASLSNPPLVFNLTQGEVPWNPQTFNEDPATSEYNKALKEVLDDDDEVAEHVFKTAVGFDPKMTYYDPSDAFLPEIGEPVVLQIDPAAVEQLNDSTVTSLTAKAIKQSTNILPDKQLSSSLDTGKSSSVGTVKSPTVHRVLPSKLDYEKVAPYFVYRPWEVIKKTIENTTQLAKSVIRYPL